MDQIRVIRVGRPQRIGPMGPSRTKGTPFLPELGPSNTMPDDLVAKMAGTSPQAIAAFRTSVPYWVLERDYKGVAGAMGLNPQALRAVIRGAKSKIVGRRGDVPSSPATGFGGLKKR